MNHRIGSVIFGLVIGLAVAIGSYQWLTNSEKELEREQQERVVQLSRELLRKKLQLSDPEIVDPLAPQRKVGKVYVYPLQDGWEVSGFYRRSDNDRWHAYLISIESDDSLRLLKVQHQSEHLAEMAARDPTLEVLP